MTNKIISFNYKINNHSDIIPVSLLEDCCGTHFRNRTKEYVVKHNIVGCYFLYDINKNIIYIGKSVNIRNRLFAHCISNYSEYITNEEKQKMILKRNKTKYFSFTEVDKEHLDFVEMGLIKLYKPILNTQYITTSNHNQNL